MEDLCERSAGGKEGNGPVFCDCCGVCFDNVTGRNIVDHNQFVEVCNPCKDELEEEEE